MFKRSVFLLGASFASLMPLSVAFSASNSAAGNGADSGYFIPPSQQPQQAAPSHPRPPVVHRRMVPVAAPVDGPEANPMAGPDMQAPPILPLPPVPLAAPVAKGAAPPPLVLGIISVQGVMMLSSAAQEIQQTLGARRDKLAHEVQKEEAAWRADQQKLQMAARSLTDEQIQKRERALQERRVKVQRDFGNKARIMQEAYQVAFHQIERELEQRGGIIANVAGAHGMNMVIHAEQVVLHVEGQDITEEVAAQLNKNLPHVYIPNDGEDPEILAKKPGTPTTADEERAQTQAAPPVATKPASDASGKKK